VVIVFVGAENMFALVNSVVHTSVTLPLKTRIAEGLSRAGASNTLKVVSYNSILGIIAVFSHGAIRQFCAFAIVVLVAHWFLVHTFFIAVLSIDIQRLEVRALHLMASYLLISIQLDELLRQNASLTSSPKDTPKRTLAPKTPWSKLVMNVQNVWRGRASRNLSLLMVKLLTSFYACPHPHLSRSFWLSQGHCVMRHLRLNHL
jgi:hypothetical protein